MAEGTPLLLERGGVRPINRKVERHLSMKPEAHTYCASRSVGSSHQDNHFSLNRDFRANIGYLRFVY